MPAEVASRISFVKPAQSPSATQAEALVWRPLYDAAVLAGVVPPLQPLHHVAPFQRLFKRTARPNLVSS